MGEILAVQIFSCDDSTCWQTGKLLFSGQCIANGNCILIVKFSACGGINGHFAFNGNSGVGLFLSTQNAAAADGRAAGKYFLFTIRILNYDGCAALCGDLGGTGLGALDGNFISVSVNVRFGFCAAADAGCTHTALCILDGDLSFDDHIAKAARAAADTGTFVAARCILDLCVAFDGHIAKAARAAADAGCTVAALCILDRCIACDGYIAIALITAANACAVVASGGFDGSTADGHGAVSANDFASGVGRFCFTCTAAVNGDLFQ